MLEDFICGRPFLCSSFICLYIDLDVFAKIHEQLEERSHGRLFAIVHFHTHQRKVTLNDIVLMQRETECTIGDRIRLNKVKLIQLSAEHFLVFYRVQTIRHLWSGKDA